MKTNQITIEEFNQFKTDLKEYNEYKKELYSLNKPIKITFDEMFGYTVIAEDDGTYTKITFPEVTTARAANEYEKWLVERSGNIVASAEGGPEYSNGLKVCQNISESVKELNLSSFIEASFNKKSYQ